MTQQQPNLPSETVVFAEGELDMGAGVPIAAEGAEQLAGMKGTSPWRRAWRRFVHHRAALASLIILLALAFMAIFAPFMHTSDPIAPDFGGLNLAPSSHHWFGTDGLGRDLYSRVVFAMRVPFITALVGSFLSIMIGMVLGVVAGFYGGKVDFALSRLTDLVFAFPSFLLALIVVSMFGPALDPYFGGGGRVIMLSGVFALVSWPGLMRFVRSLALRMREEPFVEAARVCGGTNAKIVRQHLLPNVVGLVLVQGSFIAVGLISTEAVLSIFGLGVEAPNPDLGAMLNEGVQHLGLDSWEIFFPAIMLTILILGFTFLGDGLRDALDTQGSE